VIAGWTLHYFVLSLSGVFNEINSEEVNFIFNELTGSIKTQAIFHSLFMISTVVIIAKGIKNGLEKTVTVMMPALLIIMLILLIYSITQGDFTKGVEFLLKPDFSKITSDSILSAMGHAFFTLSLGMGCVVMYGAYLPNTESIVRTTVTIVLCDTLIALLAGLVIFPIVFDNNLAPTEGPGLIFLTLPLAFAEINGGLIFGTLFFILLGFAAITSAISLLEPSVAWMIEELNVSRTTAALTIGFLIWSLGFLTILSFNELSDFTFWKGTLFDNVDYLTSNILLPISGMLFTIFASWFMSKSSSQSELNDISPIAYNIWRFLAGVVAPIGVLIVFFNAINLF